jgi:tRNA dimethylallyltransferase
MTGSRPTYPTPGTASDGPLIAIVGPTAVGKTALAVRLALDFNGEVVSADSRQIYRGMDIGTAKAGAEERQAVPHHLIDIVAPDEPLTLAQYQEAAYAAIDDIRVRGRVPLLVGGTGLYVRAVVQGLGIPRVPPDKVLRADLYHRAETEGHAALHARLAMVDPAAAFAIDARNVRRVVRALEVYLQTGQPISRLQQATPPPYHILQVGLTMDRAELYRRIDERIDRMLAAGLVEEVRALLTLGYGLDLPSMSAVGYRQVVLYLQGEIDLDEAVRRVRHDTRRFVRQQYTWFRLNDPAINWFDVWGEPEAFGAIARLVGAFLERGAIPDADRVSGG